jgi:hypothetical protein
MTELPVHREPQPDVAGYVLGTLDEPEATAFGAHLSHCAACRDEVRDLQGLASLLAESTVPELPSDLEAKTMAAVGAAAVPGPPRQLSAGPSGKVMRFPRRVLLVAAAAIVVVGLAVGLVASLGSSAPRLSTVRLADPAGGSARGTATVRATPAGLTIDMRVAGLAPSPPGTHYTCWLVGPGDSLTHQNRVSVGSFTVPSSGAADVHWTTSADLSRFPNLGVTLEPDNGNPLHQGPKVLAATTSLSTNPPRSG